MTLVVIDSSVYVSALIGKAGSAPDVVIRACIDDRIEVVVSALLLAELRRVLARAKFSRYVDPRAAEEYVARIQRHASTAPDPADVPAVVRDRDDDYLIALARQERVDAVISLDLDLLDAGLADPPVWTPRQLVDVLSE